ncbi:hypothetical protein KGQ71_01685 [Patescibacteria group bacterium]|nr:hypothetical protein [Patescibacteria group bacterium]
MIVVDIEASGLDFHSHSLLSIGAVDFSHPENRFYGECRLIDGAGYTEEALGVNGFTPEQIHDPDKQSAGDLLHEFIRWSNSIPDQTIAGHNTSFDRDFLQATADRFGIDWKVGFRTLDLHTLAYAHFLRSGLVPPTENRVSTLNSETIMPYVGLPVEPKPHHGLTGAQMEAEAFSRFIYGKNLLSEYASYPLPDYLVNLHTP